MSEVKYLDVDAFQTHVFKYYDQRIAESITRMGQFILAQTIEKVQKVEYQSTYDSAIELRSALAAAIPILKARRAASSRNSRDFDAADEAYRAAKLAMNNSFSNIYPPEHRVRPKLDRSSQLFYPGDVVRRENESFDGVNPGSIETVENWCNRYSVPTVTLKNRDIVLFTAKNFSLIKGIDE